MNAPNQPNETLPDSEVEQSPKPQPQSSSTSGNSSSPDSRLTEEGKWQLVNRAQSLDELNAAIYECRMYQDENGTSTTPEWIVEEVRKVYHMAAPVKSVTTLYGIRQQLMHIMYFQVRLHTL